MEAAQTRHLVEPGGVRRRMRHVRPRRTLPPTCNVVTLHQVHLERQAAAQHLLLLGVEAAIVHRAAEVRPSLALEDQREHLAAREITRGVQGARLLARAHEPPVRRRTRSGVPSRFSRKRKSPTPISSRSWPSTPTAANRATMSWSGSRVSRRTVTLNGCCASTAVRSYAGAHAHRGGCGNALRRAASSASCLVVEGKA